MTYTIRVLFADYNNSILEVHAADTTEALIMALDYCRTYRQHLGAVIQVAIEA